MDLFVQLINMITLYINTYIVDVYVIIHIVKVTLKIDVLHFEVTIILR